MDAAANNSIIIDQLSHQPQLEQEQQTQTQAQFQVHPQAQAQVQVQVQVQPEPELQPEQQQAQPEAQLKSEAQGQPEEEQSEIDYAPGFPAQAELQATTNWRGTDGPPSTEAAELLPWQTDPMCKPESEPQPPPQAQLKPERQMQPQSRFIELEDPSSDSPIVAKDFRGNPEDLSSLPGFNPGAPNPSNLDGVSELQKHAELAESRVRLMDTTLDILFDTFKNKYELDKALEKDCAKRLKAKDKLGESSDKTVEENLQILAESSNWVGGQLEQLEICVREKRRNTAIAGPLVDEKEERKKEEKQVRRIERIAEKIRRRAKHREVKEDSKREKKIVENISQGRAVTWVDGVQ